MLPHRESSALLGYAPHVRPGPIRVRGVSRATTAKSLLNVNP